MSINSGGGTTKGAGMGDVNANKLPRFGEEEENRPYLSGTLVNLVDELIYKPHWYSGIEWNQGGDGSGGWTFYMVSYTENSLKLESFIRVKHAFLIPAASYNRDTWAAWLFERVRDIETHEAGEFFKLGGYREFAPHHSNGEDPYMVHHVGDHVTARKRSGDD